MWEGPLPILPPGGYFFMKRGKKYQDAVKAFDKKEQYDVCLLYTSPSPRDA